MISIIDIMQNTERLYDGSLLFYFKIVFNAPNVNAPYHNFRHMMHVTCQAYDAIKYYKGFDKRGARALLIAAMFHDYGHKGTIGNDSENIANAISFVHQYLLSEDKDLLSEIEELISATQFPHIKIDNLSISGKILRDADMTQALDDVWIQDTIFCLSREFGKTPNSLIEQQIDFISNLKFYTEWAIQKFSDKKEIRLAQIKQMLKMLVE